MATLPLRNSNVTPVRFDKVIRYKFTESPNGSRLYWLEEFNDMAEERLGLNGLDKSPNTEIRFGNEVSVLLKSDTPGWREPYKKKIIDKLFVPCVQIYVVKQNGK